MRIADPATIVAVASSNSSSTSEGGVDMSGVGMGGSRGRSGYVGEWTAKVRLQRLSWAGER